jgi:hypothetical protein
MTQKLNPKHQKYLDALLDMYDKLTNDIYYTPTEMVNDYHLNTYFATFLISEKIILREKARGSYMYKWNSIKPNKHMAIRLIELCRLKSNEARRDRANRKSQKKHLKVAKTCDNQVVTEVFTTENKKYLEFLLEIYFKCKNKEEGFVRPLIDSYGIHKNASQVLMHYGYMIRKDGTREYEWLKTIPNYEMAKQFELDMKDFRKKVARKYTDKKQDKPRATTITKSYFFGLIKVTKQTS